MSGFLLDTNCISEVVRPQPDLRVVEWMEATSETLLHLSVLTLGEIRKGLWALPQSARKAKLETWLEVDLKARFHGRILPVDSNVADRWGILAAEAKRKGKALPVIDGLLASTALHHNLTVVSRNTADFSNARVSVLNLWQS
jgi:predicted nucleic acid-binding protein